MTTGPKSSRRQQESNRKIRPHKKSRGGCSNCKLRSVKCDENKPQCKRCIDYGVLCSYDRKKTELEIAVANVATIITFPQTIPYWPDTNSELLDKFKVRTALTVSTGKRLEIYQNQLIKLTETSPSLRHAIKALALMHDRHIHSPSNTKLSVEEADHWYEATSAVKEGLSQTQSVEQSAAICAAAALLGTLTFCQIEARTPYEAWPLAPSSSSDLDWLKMSDGKTRVWTVSQVLHGDPVFSHLITKPPTNLAEVGPHENPFAAFPEDFISLYDLDVDFIIDNHYERAARILGSILNSQSVVQIVLSFWGFVGSMDPAFKQLLEWKEPRALLLLAWWFARLSSLPIWWLRRRVVLEGQAMCIYLEQHAAYDANVQSLLTFPRTAFEAAASSTTSSAGTPTSLSSAH